MSEETRPGVCVRCGRGGARPCAVYAAVAKGDLCASCETEVHRVVRRTLQAPSV